MSNYPELIKKKLLAIIHKMAVSTVSFVKKPNKDFTKNRRLPLESMIKLILLLITLKKYQEYRLLAVDGFKLNIAYNAKDKESHFESRQDCKGYNQLYLDIMYDLCNKLYIDAIVQGGRK